MAVLEQPTHEQKPPRRSAVRRPGLLTLAPGEERYTVPGGGAIAVPIHAGDRGKLVNVDLSELIWVKLLGMPLPKLWIIREMFGIGFCLAYLALPPILAAGPFRRFYQKMGAARYYVGSFLFLIMMALPIKMVLRWLFNLKYIVHIQEIFFNV